MNRGYISWSSCTEAINLQSFNYPAINLHKSMGGRKSSLKAPQSAQAGGAAVKPTLTGSSQGRKLGPQNVPDDI